jgi:CheY-like chemotaxis protein
VSQVSACGGAAVLEVIDSLSSLRPDERGPVVVVSSVRMSDVDGLGVAEHAWCAGAPGAPVSVVLLGDSTPHERARARELEAVLIEGPEGFSRLVSIVAQLLTPPTIH